MSMTSRRKQFKLMDLHRDIASVLLHHAGESLCAFDIFRELYESCEHYGWELEMLSISVASHAMARHGLIEMFGVDFAANDKTAEIFDKVAA